MPQENYPRSLKELSNLRPHPHSPVFPETSSLACAALPGCWAGDRAWVSQRYKENGIREVKQFAPGHTTSKRQDLGWSQGFVPSSQALSLWQWLQAEVLGTPNDCCFPHKGSWLSMLLLFFVCFAGERGIWPSQSCSPPSAEKESCLLDPLYVFFRLKIQRTRLAAARKFSLWLDIPHWKDSLSDRET